MRRSTPPSLKLRGTSSPERMQHSEGAHLYPSSHGLSYAASLAAAAHTRVQYPISARRSGPASAPAEHRTRGGDDKQENDKSRVAGSVGQTRMDQEETMARTRARVTRRQMLRAGAGAL